MCPASHGLFGWGCEIRMASSPTLLTTTSKATRKSGSSGKKGRKFILFIQPIQGKLPKHGSPHAPVFRGQSSDSDVTNRSEQKRCLIVKLMPSITAGALVDPAISVVAVTPKLARRPAGRERGGRKRESSSRQGQGAGGRTIKHVVPIVRPATHPIRVGSFVAEKVCVARLTVRNYIRNRWYVPAHRRRRENDRICRGNQGIGDTDHGTAKSGLARTRQLQFLIEIKFAW